MHKKYYEIWKLLFLVKRKDAQCSQTESQSKVEIEDGLKTYITIEDGLKIYITRNILSCHILQF